MPLFPVAAGVLNCYLFLISVQRYKEYLKVPNITQRKCVLFGTFNISRPSAGSGTALRQAQGPPFSPAVPELVEGQRKRVAAATRRTTQ